MKIKCLINDAFIEKWHPKYDEIETDEGEYKVIIDKVSNELQRKGTISENTFSAIYDWKKCARAKPHVQWKHFYIYERAIGKCLKDPDNQKLGMLIELPGVGVSMGSAILHFMYPQHFPIMDIRTVEVLYYAGYINSRTKSQKSYISFRDAIMKIAEDYPRWSLRQIDRALFAYHKIVLEPKIKGTHRKAKRCS